MAFDRGVDWHIRQHVASWRRLGAMYVPKAGPCPWELSGDSTEAPAEEDPHAERRRSLQMLFEETSQCFRCPALAATRSKVVSGIGAMQPELCIVGDYPAAEDDEAGVPFQGSTAETMAKMIAAMGRAPERVYRTVAVRCKPPGSRTASVAECRNCREYLVRELELVQPQAIVCFGITAMQVLMDHEKTLREVRGIVADYRGVPVVCTHHPRAFATLPEAKRQSWDDLQKLMQRMNWSKT